MQKKYLFFFLVSFGHAAQNLYFIDKGPDILDESVPEQTTPSPFQSSPTTTSTPSKFLDDKSIYLKANRMWWSVAIAQNYVSLGDSQEFIDDSILRNTQNSLSVVTSKDRKAVRALGLSLMQRYESLAWGVSADYLEHEQRITSVSLVDSTSVNTSVVSNLALKTTFIPIQLKLRYYPFDGYMLQPFVGVDFGVEYQDSRVKASSINQQGSSWLVGSRSIEAGILVCLSPSISVDIAARSLIGYFRSAPIIQPASGGATTSDVEIRLKSPTYMDSVRVGLNFYL